MQTVERYPLLSRHSNVHGGHIRFAGSFHMTYWLSGTFYKGNPLYRLTANFHRLDIKHLVRVVHT